MSKSPTSRTRTVNRLPHWSSTGNAGARSHACSALAFLAGFVRQSISTKAEPKPINRAAPRNRLRDTPSCGAQTPLPVLKSPKDYRIEGPGRYTTMTLDLGEFIRRFLIHVLPKGFHRSATACINLL